MWTPRRIVLLGIGLAIYLTCYLVYARSFLGSIDGLPALPDIYMFVSGDPDLPRPRDPNRHPPVEEKLKKAFGRDCPELRCAIKLDINAKRMVLAADKFQIVEDGSGRAMLTPISIALFSKDKATGENPDINTIRARVAYLRFDRPVASLAEINGRKIVEAELIDNIEIVNNRHTPEDRLDDLFINIAKGPLYYEEARHLIWTRDTIHLNDMQSKPKPNQVWGKGMEMELLTEAPPSTPNQPLRKGKQESITGAKKITLLSDVIMDLYVESGNNFPSGGATPPEKEKGKKTNSGDNPNKSLIKIRTPGRFVYEFAKDRGADMAHFEVADNDPNKQSNTPQDVTVERILDPKSRGEDQLVCQKLTLKINRGATSSAPPKDSQGVAKSPEQNLQIQSMRATGSEVVLLSDSENLRARCVELFHDTTANRTTLIGKPQMWAMKEENEIKAHELHLIQKTSKPDKANPEGKKSMEILAIGPGQIDMYDKETKTKNTHAFWNDKLTKIRDTEGDYDVLTLTGSARFVDDAHEQSLKAEMIKVWLEDRPQSAPAKVAVVPNKGKEKGKDTETNSPLASQAQSVRPHHLEARTNVVAISKDLNIHDTNRLSVSFKDIPESQMPARANGQQGLNGNSKSSTRPGESPKAVPTGSAPGALPNSVVGNASGPAGMLPKDPEKEHKPVVATEEKKETNNPIDVKASTIQAWVLRSESRTTLERVWCEHDVVVLQEASKPGERGVDIRGATLELEPQPEGNQLNVTGDLAQLQMGKIYIVGAEIKIDQASNKAWVTGAGAMQMESDTTFDGQKMKESLPLHITWDRTMVFNGSMKLADFSGDIQAEQGDAHLTCQTLQVVFDRPISLTDSRKNETQARVKDMICDKNVIMEEEVKNPEKTRTLKLTKITTKGTVTIEREEDDQPVNPTPLTNSANPKPESNRVTATGPGYIRIWQADSGDNPLANPTDKTKPKPQNGGPTSPSHSVMPPNPVKPVKPGGGDPSRAEGQMKLTNIHFATNMLANTRTNKAIFRGNVRVLSMPSDSPQVKNDFETPPNPKDMPPDGIYLTCEQLTLLNRKSEDGKSNQEMEALRRVRVQARNYWGVCDSLTYNEAKDQIIFIGSEATPARLFRVTRTGSPPEETRGKKIIYIRSTGEFQVDGGGTIQLQQ